MLNAPVYTTLTLKILDNAKKLFIALIIGAMLGCSPSKETAQQQGAAPRPNLPVITISAQHRRYRSRYPALQGTVDDKTTGGGNLEKML
jgi:hypothetical protein